VATTQLVRLEIEDYELIERAELAFDAGFTVCSGETGSGKTMLLGALDFVLGERSSADVVRRGADRARVTLAIDADATLREHLAESGFPSEDGESTLFVREMSAAGKSTARVNGSLATAAQVRALAGDILESVGQHEQQRLLAPGYALDALDAFAGEPALGLRRAVAEAYERANLAERALKETLDDAGRAAAELASARAAVEEIDALAIVPGEDVALRDRRAYLGDIEKIRAALESAHAALAPDASQDGATSAGDALGDAATALASVARYSAPLGELARTLAALQSDAQDAAIALARELEASDFDPAEREVVGARLDALEKAKKKYGGDLASVLETRERFAEALERDATRDERIAELRAQSHAASEALDREAAALSNERKRAAGDLEKRVAEELAGLAMPAARFAVVFESLDHPTLVGNETVDFALSPNPGEPLRPLGRAASGGELSRVLLALVVATAERRSATALVFDEIDAGIGGATATAVGVRLGSLARSTQVLCVTHLAQIASWADKHYALRKRERNGSTIVELVPLGDRAALVDEVARMLSGNVTAVAREHAETLVREVRARKAKTKLSA
jgi:DNA repair protein RecN (Recombination protein N)